MKTRIFFFIAILICIGNTIYSQDAIICAESSLTSSWTSIGPYEDNTSNLGRVIAIWVSPDDPDYILIGTRSSGLWKTINGGVNWSNLTNFQLPACGVSSIAVFDNETLIKTDDQIYVTTVFYGTEINVYNIGLAFSEDNGATWQYDTSIPNYIGFIKSGNIGSPGVFIKPETDQLFVLNGTRIFVKDLSTGNWSLFKDINDFSIDDNHYVTEIDFLEGYPDWMIVSFSEGNTSDIYYTHNGGTNWNAIPAPAIPTITSYNFVGLNTSSCVVNSEMLYILYTYNFQEDGGSGVMTSSYLYRYTVPIGGTISITETHNVDGLTSGLFSTDNIYESRELLIPADKPDIGFIRRAQGELFKIDIPIIGSISAYDVTKYYGDNTHADIRDFTYFRSGSVNYIYIAHDGGVSRCDNKEALANVSSSTNDLLWQNINGNGLTITEFNGFGVSELEENKIFAGSGDGNSFIIQNNLYTPGMLDYFNYPNKSDYIRAEVSTTDVHVGATNRNGGFFKVATTEVYNLSTRSGASNSILPLPLPTPEIGLTIADDGNTNWSYRPFDFDMEGFLWMASVDVFRFEKYTSATGLTEFPDDTYGQQSKTYFKNINLNTNDVISNNPITSYLKIKNYPETGQTTLYFALKEKANSEEDVKLVSSIYDPSAADQFSSNNITPYNVIGVVSGESQVNYSWITDIEYDEKNPQRLWVSFGASKGNFDNPWLTQNSPEKRGKVYFSQDGGVTWYDRSEGLPNYPVLCLTYWRGTNDIIFAGTDVGVFVWHADPLSTEGDGTWECFNTNLPYCSVNDLEINNCTNTIKISTFGFGLWETPLPDVQIEITENTTWTQTMYAYHNIDIHAGATLMIENCEIRMPIDGKIIVENGGSLILDGGVITNTCDFWDGIEVWGIGNAEVHPSEAAIITGAYPINSTDHGIVYIKNNSTIKNAKRAISTFNSDDPTNSDFYGGIIIAKESNFVNNIISIDIKPFDYTAILTDDNTSKFEKCTFSRNNEMPLQTDNLSDVYLNDVDGVEFFDCHFVNTFTDCESINNSPEGITGTNATFDVTSELCLVNPPECVVSRGSFEGYYRAVHAANTVLCTNPTVIEGIDFLNNERAILLSNNAIAEITRCNFEIPDFTDRSTYGLYLESSFNYHVEGNLFKSYGTLTSGSYYCSGLFVENNSNKATEIYRNTFEDIEIGIRSQGNNSKLQLKCNEFRNSGATNFFNYNIIVTSGVLGNQGICNASITEPAGNKFNSGYAPGYAQSEFRIVPSGVNINYRHHTEAEFIPDYYTSAQINLQNCSVSGESDCPSTLTEELEVEERTVNPALLLIEEADEIKLTIESEKVKIDGGNTNDLIEEINTAVSPTTLMNEINEISPYLSNEAMASILQTEPISTGDVLTILSENYPIADSLQSTIELSNYEIPSPVVDFLTENIINDTLITSPYNDLLATINVLSADREQLLIDAAYIYIDNQPFDSSINYLQNYDEDWAKQLLIGFSTNSGEFESAESLLTSYYAVDDPNYVQFYNLIIDLAKSNRSIYEITETEESILRLIATKDYHSGVAAQNILDAVFQEKYPEIIDEIPELMVRLADFDINSTNQWFKIYPNPADNILYIEITNWDINTNYWANIYDLSGIRVASFDLRTDYKLSWIETEKILTGMYLIEVHSGSEILGTQKIIFE